ncbi:RHS repeat-associated core domain-containing protein [Pseudomonas sp. AA-38]|uniref:RHS repeat-associated core domain-containing protein n=1 Tax=Pseudomonas sp. AA-38 TaxID=3028807 RepID=UPI0023F8674F|nr:RHS repeat-associated core domain-containing protein [Pseudomonas sp. AA-38]
MHRVKGFSICWYSLIALALLPINHVLAEGLRWSNSSHQVYMGDYNKDGRSDIYLRANPLIVPLPQLEGMPLVVPRRQHDVVLLGDGAGQFSVLGSIDRQTLGTITWQPAAYELLSGDFNGDGSPDLLLRPSASGENALLLTLSAAGAPTLAQVLNSRELGVELSQSGGYAMKWQDANGDGKADLILSKPGTEPLLLLGSASGLATAVPYSSVAVPEDGTAARATAWGIAEGEAQVTLDGRLAYNFPLQAPPAVNQVQPNLAFAYQGSEAESFLGQGWGLGGLMRIQRCPATIDQDGFSGLPSGSAQDRLCLDGQRLVLVAGQAWQPGSEYRTEIDAFHKVIQKGSANDPYFEVRTASGLIVTLGKTAASRIVPSGGKTLAWQTETVEDRSGNRFDVSYGDDGMGLPQSITYAEGRVEFEYQARQPGFSQFALGGELRLDRLLERVQMFAADGSRLREYRLGYSYSPNTRKPRVAFIQHCADSQCLEPVRFDYKAQPGGLSDKGLLATAKPMLSNLLSVETAMDWNGDGVNDLLTVYVDRITVALGSEAGLAADTRLVSASGFSFLTATPIDVDGDGLQEILYLTVKSGSPNQLTWHYLKQDGTSHKVVEWQANDLLAVVTNFGGSLPPGQNILATAAKAVALDFNHDGRLDVLLPAKGSWQVYENRPGSGSGFVESSRFANIPVTATPWFEPYGLDGEGRWLLLTSNITNDVQTYAVLPVPRQGSVTAAQKISLGIPVERSVILDANGDGLLDFAVPNASNQIQLYLNKGGAPSATGYKLVNTGLSAAGIFAPAGPRRDSENYLPKPMDYDGDGRQDLLFLDNASQRYAVLRSSGDGFLRVTTGVPIQIAAESYDASLPGCENYLARRAELLAAMARASDPEWKRFYSVSLAMLDMACKYVAAGPLTAPHHSLIGDWNGDGQEDLLLAAQNGNAITWRLYTQTRQHTEWLQGITDSLGNRSLAEYGSIRDSAVYQGGMGGQFPVLDWRGPRWLLSALKQSDGIGGLRDTRFEYRNGKINLLGRGFLGFAEIIRHEPARQLTQTQQLQQTFPFIGRLSQERVERNGELQSRATWQWRSDTTFAGKVHVPQLESSVQEQFEQGVAVSATRRQQTLDIQYGTLLEERLEEAASATGPALRTTRTVRQYRNEDSTWLIGFLSQEQTQIQSDGYSTSYLHRFSPQAGTLLVAEEARYADDPALKQTITYQHDTRGRVAKVSRSGAGFTSRSEQYGDYQGASPGYQRNALGHEERFTYVPGTDLVSQHQDANGLITHASYDPFGRELLVRKPDGSQVQRSYQRCSGMLACPTQAHLAIRERTLNASGNQQGAPERWRYLDALGREVRTRHQGFDGAWVNVDNHYDALGRLVRQSEPYTQAPVYEETSWDFKDRPLSRTLPSGMQIAYSYGVRSSGGSWREYSLNYEQQGSKTRVERRENDALGQLVLSRNAVGSSLETSTSYAYDAAGNLRWTRVNGDPRTVIRMAYDAAGNRTLFHDPNSGELRMRYDALGNLLEAQAADGSRVVSQYDLLGRRISRTDYDVDGQVKEGSLWQYDQAANGLGQLSAMASNDQGFMQVYSYDALSRPSARQTSIQAAGSTLTYNDGMTYDGFSRPNSVLDASGFRYVKHYNGYGYLQGESDQASGASLRRIEAQNVRDQITRVVYGNGVTSQSEYDEATGWLEQQLAGTAQGNFQQLSYSYAQNGLLLTREDGRGLRESFDYDLLQRLTSSTRQLAGQILQQQYRYDALGNLLQTPNFNELNYGGYSDAGQSTCAAQGGVPSPGPHAVLQSPSGYYCYDARGNQIGAPGRTIDYSLYDKPLRISEGGQHSDFRYDPERRRYLQTTSARLTVYIDEGRFEEVHEKGQRRQNSYIGDYLQVSRVVGSEQFQFNYQLRDQLGSLESVTDGSGALVERRSYAPFGAVRGADWSDTPAPLMTTRRGFTDHEHLPESGLIHMNGRVYDPALGRFLSADIVYQDTANGQAFNRYSYGFNSPFSGVDPTGYALEEAGAPSNWFQLATQNMGFTLSNTFLGNEPLNWLYASIGIGKGMASSFLYMAPVSDPVTMPYAQEIGDGITGYDMYGIPVFDESHPMFHHYYTSNSCVQGLAGCSYGNAVAGLLRYPAPGGSGEPIINGQTSFAMPVGRVRHVVIDGGSQVVNVTLPGWQHILHPGIVRRWVTKDVFSVTIHTYGEGTGALPRANEFFSDFLWRQVDENIFDYMRQQK